MDIGEVGFLPPGFKDLFLPGPTVGEGSESSSAGNGDPLRRIGGFREERRAEREE
jgi:hypothetical protein